MSTAVLLDRVTHTYTTTNDKLLPGVTQILDGNGCVDHFGFSDETRARGTYVHEATVIIDRGERLANVPIEYEPFITAYRRFVRDMQPVWSRSEEVVADLINGYAGTLDRAGLVQGVPVVVDIKTGEVPPSVGPQTAAYVRCLPDAHRWQRYCLQLRPDGQYRWLPLADKADHAVFLAALTLYRWKERYRVGAFA
jgi:hypothetical protein